MSVRPSLGAMVRRRRLELGLTQEDLAERIGDGTRQAEISRLEHDRIGLPRRTRLERIAGALDLSLGDLLAGSGWAGADTAAWIPRQEARGADSKIISRTRLKERVQLNPNYSDELTIAIENAHEIAAHTRALLERSDHTFDLVRRAVSREASNDTSREKLPND
jgi:transcriptional regulator with XRE-family HTH domain